MTLAGATGVGAMAPNAYPATFSFLPDAASCAHDYAVYVTGLAGCAHGYHPRFHQYVRQRYLLGHVPSNAFAYNTGGTATQVAGLVSGRNADRICSVSRRRGQPCTSEAVPGLRWQRIRSRYSHTRNGGQLPGACTARPCPTTLAFSGSANATNSAPFYVYFGGADGDSIFVGDDTGKLHKFTAVFFGTPTEVTTTWPVTVDAGAVLTSPVYEFNSANVFVGDSKGKLSHVASATGAVTSSATLSAAGSTGIVDAPLIDSSPATPLVYAFVGDSAASTDLVEQFSTTFASGATATATANVGLTTGGSTSCRN